MSWTEQMFAMKLLGGEPAGLLGRRRVHPILPNFGESHGERAHPLPLHQRVPQAVGLPAGLRPGISSR